MEVKWAESPVSPRSRVGAIVLVAGMFFVGVTAVAEALSSAARLPAAAYGHLPLVDGAAVSPAGDKAVIAIADVEGNQAFRVIDAATGEHIDGTRVGASGRESERSVLRSIGWASDQHVTYDLSATFATDRVLPPGVIAPGVSRVDLWRTALHDLESQRRYFVSRGESVDWGLGLVGLRAPIDGAPGEGRLVMYDSPFRGRHMSVYRVNLDSGRLTRLHRGTIDTLDFVLGPNGDPVARVDVNNATNAWSIHALFADETRLVMSGISSTGEPPEIAGLTRDGDLAFLDDPDGRGRAVLFARSLHDGAVRVLVEDAEHDVGPAIHDPWTHAVVGAVVVREEPKQHFLEPELGAVVDAIAARAPRAVVMLVNWSRDRKRYIAYIESPQDAGGYYVFDRADGKLRRLGMRYPQLVGKHLGDRFAIRYPARDGTMIPAYLTLPSGRELAGLPLVVLVHGGPAVRDDFSFDWWSSFLASRGYAVVQPNYRGSAGYGTAWQEAGYRQWGELMQHDVEDAVVTLTQPGKADPKRVCIVGASYGGYAALAGVTLTPERYRCAISVAGVSDLEMMLRCSERVMGDESIAADWWRMLIGDRATETERIRAASPAMQAERARAPVLLVHGANDVVVPIAQSERMEQRLRAAGKSVRLVRFDGEDHWLSDATTRIRMLEESEAFLAEHLGTNAPTLPDAAATP